MTAERSAKADLVVGACERFAQYVPLNAAELFCWYMEQKDVEMPERFLQQQQVQTQNHDGQQGESMQSATSHGFAPMSQNHDSSKEARSARGGEALGTISKMAQYQPLAEQRV